METWITPTLRVTDDATLTPVEAHALITASSNDPTWPIADVASFSEARLVMKMLGMTEEQIEDRCHFALTGEILNG